MSTRNFRRLTGSLLILGAALVNVPYAALIARFDYPDILRAPVDVILTRFQAGGPSLILTWLAFAWVGLPMLVGAILLKRVLADEDSPFIDVATTIAVIGFVVQVVGLLRWVFVVPVLARVYTDPSTSLIGKEALSAAFTAVHQYGGVALGEHLGQFFIILWMSMICGIIYRSRLFARWIAFLGWFASIVYLLAQGDLLATAIPGFPMVEWAGLVGSLLWLVWMIVMGLSLILRRAD